MGSSPDLSVKKRHPHQKEVDKSKSGRSRSCTSHIHARSHGSIYSSSLKENMSPLKGRYVSATQPLERSLSRSRTEQRIIETPKVIDKEPTGGNIKNLERQSFMNAELTPTNQADDSNSQAILKKQLRDLTSAVGQIQSQLVKVLSGIGDIKDQLKETVVPSVNHGPIDNLQDYFCATLEEFQDFNIKLERDADFRNSICHGIKPKINLTTKLQFSIAAILRILVHVNIFNHYTAQKKVANKELLINSPLWKCITGQIAEEAARHGLPQVKDADIQTALSYAINNIKSEKKTPDGDATQLNV
ncbi:uncharacterized protein [Fopius arisanus]|uniref:Uncharacterized protein n=2 Tax=Fopius arisanus TaxID=64838 RepID=A0A9R1UAG7_9HYME|nr:PREDICTED: uncharacterized protein LOC105272682 [Fopius arisanus]